MYVFQGGDCGCEAKGLAPVHHAERRRATGEWVGVLGMISFHHEGNAGAVVVTVWVG